MLELSYRNSQLTEVNGITAVDLNLKQINYPRPYIIFVSLPLLYLFSYVFPRLPSGAPLEALIP